MEHAVTAANTSASSPLIDVPARLARLRIIARLMDSSIGLPGTRFRFGLDSLFGLAPVVGDAAGALVAFYIVWEARRIGAPSQLVARMMGNVAMDTLSGSIPLVGDLFDVAFKSNMRNIALLEEWLGQRQGDSLP